ncbi:MAG: tyrosine-type recombinase/integrase [Gammaproteobacteria bacterium]|jgi:integrase
MRFTDKFIQSLKPKSTRYDVREGNGNGFVIRCAPSGNKSWVYFYCFEGKKRRMTLGNYPALSLAEARKKHHQALTSLAKGIDPATDAIRKKNKARSAQTVNDLIDEYLEKWAKPRKRSWQEDERMLKKDIAPVIGRKKVKDITRRDIILILDGVLERGSPIAANRTLAVARRMFNFAVERDIAAYSPCHMVKSPSKENRKERMLNDAEIKSFWFGLNNAAMADLTKLALKLQLVTAQRKGEIVSAEWNEFDLNNHWWEIPKEKTKNSNHHRVPLSQLAISLLKQIKELSGESKWLFPSPIGNTHMTGAAVDRALRRNKHVFKNTEPAATPHDLRRTAASHMTAIGTPRLVVSKILNHVENGVTAIYDRHSYDNEKKSALSLWSEKIKRIIA